MTNFEAILARLYPYKVDDALIVIACTDAGITAQDEYVADNKTAVAKAAIDCIKQLIVLTAESIGGCSLSYETQKLGQRIYTLAKDNGLADIAQEFNPSPQVFFM